MNENELSYIIRGCIFDVYNTLGPGLLESVYEKALEYELKQKGLDVKTQIDISVHYKDITLDIGFRLDLVVNDLVIIELKSVENLHNVHYKQLLTYLKLTNKKLGLLVNFNSDDMKENIKRVVNNL